MPAQGHDKDSQPRASASAACSPLPFMVHDAAIITPHACRAHLVDWDEDKQRLEAVHPAQRPPKPLNLRLQPPHQLAVAAQGRGDSRAALATLRVTGAAFGSCRRSSLNACTPSLLIPRACGWSTRSCRCQKQCAAAPRAARTQTPVGSGQGGLSAELVGRLALGQHDAGQQGRRCLVVHPAGLVHHTASNRLRWSQHTSHSAPYLEEQQVVAVGRGAALHLVVDLLACGASPAAVEGV